MTKTPPSINLAQWKASASIDYITIERPEIELESISETELLSSLAKISEKTVLPKKTSYGKKLLTVHDPNRETLQTLIELFPNSEIQALEISVDLRPKDRSVSIAKLEQIHTWLKTCLFPQRHKQMTGKSHRKQFDPHDTKIKRIALKPQLNNRTVYWQNLTSFEQIRLYIKETDAYIDPVIPSARIELTLNRGGCQMAGLKRLYTLPDFSTNLRRYASPFFNIAVGIKPIAKRIRSKDPIKLKEAADDTKEEQLRVTKNWHKYGATWAAKHGYKVLSDKTANKLIGDSLSELRRSLMKLNLPQKSWKKLV